MLLMCSTTEIRVSIRGDKDRPELSWHARRSGTDQVLNDLAAEGGGCSAVHADDEARRAWATSGRHSDAPVPAGLRPLERDAIGDLYPLRRLRRPARTAAKVRADDRTGTSF